MGALESELSLSLSSDSGGGGLFGLGDLRVGLLSDELCRLSLSLLLGWGFSPFTWGWTTAFFRGGGEGDPDSESESSLSSSSRFLLAMRPLLVTGDGLRFLLDSGDSTGLLLSEFPPSGDLPLTGLLGDEASLESDSDSEEELSLSSFFGGGGDLLLMSDGPSLIGRSSDLLCRDSLL